MFVKYPCKKYSHAIHIHIELLLLIEVSLHDLFKHDILKMHDLFKRN